MHFLDYTKNALMVIVIAMSQFKVNKPRNGRKAVFVFRSQHRGPLRETEAIQDDARDDTHSAYHR